MPVINVFPLSSKFTLQYLLYENAWNSFQYFSFTVSTMLSCLNNSTEGTL